MKLILSFEKFYRLSSGTRNAIYSCWSPILNLFWTECVTSLVESHLRRHFFFRFFSLFSGSSDSTSSVDTELLEREKLLQNLDFCVDKIGDIFGLGQVVEDVEGNLLDEDQKNKVPVFLKIWDEVDKEEEWLESMDQRIFWALIRYRGLCLKVIANFVFLLCMLKASIALVFRNRLWLGWKCIFNQLWNLPTCNFAKLF